MIKPFDLNLKHLRALVAAAGQGSLSRAADSVGLSQPALTQGLRRLEEKLDLQLVERRSDGVIATPAGTALNERVVRAFDYLAAAVPHHPRSGRGFNRPEQLMTSAQLEAFLHFASTQSFAGAAVASGLSQPAIHKAVRDLEQICAVPLAERRGRGVALTAAGRKVARGVRLAAAELSAGINEARGDTRGFERIAVGAMPLCRAKVLPRALTDFLDEAPETRVDVLEGSWRELIEPLLDGMIDLMIGALRDEPPAGVEQKPLFEDELAIFARTGHPILEQDVDLDLLTRQKWIVGAVGTPLRAHWQALFQGRPEPAVPIECGSVMVIRGVLAESDLLTLLSPHQVALEVESGMLARVRCPLRSSRRTIGITTRADWRPTRTQRQFLEHIDSAARESRLREIL
jgi:DNA-binding transcriptional LysR family regulator